MLHQKSAFNVRPAPLPQSFEQRINKEDYGDYQLVGEPDTNLLLDKTGFQLEDDRLDSAISETESVV